MQKFGEALFHMMLENTSCIDHGEHCPIKDIGFGKASMKLGSGPTGMCALSRYSSVPLAVFCG